MAALLAAKLEVQEEEEVMEDAGDGDEEDEPEDEYEGEEGEGADAEFPAARDDGGALTDREKILRTALVVRPRAQARECGAPVPCCAAAGVPCPAALVRAPDRAARTGGVQEEQWKLPLLVSPRAHVLPHANVFKGQGVLPALARWCAPTPTPPFLRPAGFGVLS
jgi:hypothetical protein